MEVDSVSGGTITGKTTESWQKLAPNGGNSVNVGLIVSSKTQDFIPKSIKVNGVSRSNLAVQ